VTANDGHTTNNLRMIPHRIPLAVEVNRSFAQEVGSRRRGQILAKANPKPNSGSVH
jgi:hypothetical protein